MTKETIIQNTILRTVRGSLVYGTEVTKEETNHYGLDSSSDEDFFRITVAPLQDIFSLTNPFQSANWKDPDEDVHELKSYMKLALGANPNILEPLATPEEFITDITGEGRILRANLHLFLARKTVAKSYFGYSKAQFKRYILHQPEGGKRQDLWARFGYDTKAAYHIVRLLKTGIEILTEAVLRVRRPDRDLLKAIRLGRYTREQFLELVEDLKADFRAAEERSELPSKPDYDKAVDLYRSICLSFYGNKLTL